jgi:hypothetical protein
MFAKSGVFLFSSGAMKFNSSICIAFVFFFWGCGRLDVDASDTKGSVKDVVVFLREMFCLPAPKTPTDLLTFQTALIKKSATKAPVGHATSEILQSILVDHIVKNSAISRSDIKKTLEKILSSDAPQCGGAVCSKVFGLRSGQIDGFLDDMYAELASNHQLLLPENAEQRSRLLRSLIEAEEGPFPLIGKEFVQDYVASIFDKTPVTKIVPPEKPGMVLGKNQIKSLLDSQELEQIRKFTKGGYQQIRGVQSFSEDDLLAMNWHGPMIKKWKARSDVLIRALEKLQVFEGTVFRGVNNVTGQDLAFLARSWSYRLPIGLGRNYKPAVASASRNFYVAQRFLTDNFEDDIALGQYGILFEIHTKKGAPIEEVSLIKLEREVVLPFDALYEIKRIAPLGVSKKLIYVELQEISYPIRGAAFLPDAA